MQNIRSIYSHNPDIRLQNLRVRRLRLNRHLPEARWIADHHHAHSQVLLYLGGSGWQKLADENHAIEKGHLFLIPPGVPHAFVEPAGQKPLCLAIDFDLTPPVQRVIVKRLNSLELGQVRHALSHLGRWRTGREQIEPGEAAEVLRLMDIFLRASGFLRGRAASHEQHPVFRATQHALRDPASYRRSLAELAGTLGYHPDYLNRTLKTLCGLTLGQLRNEARMEVSQRLLARAASIAEVAEQAGFDDPNYFARWFREQTGRTPSAWRAARPGGRET